MSAMGQYRTSRSVKGMSALPPKADIGTQPRDVRFVPKADIERLIANLVGATDQRMRNCNAERLRGFQVDNQFVFGRRLHGKIGWLLAFEDAIDVNRGAAVPFGETGSIGDETAGSDEGAFVVNRRQLVSRC